LNVFLGTLPGRIVDVVAGAAAGSAAVVAALGDPNAEQGLKLIVSVHADWVSHLCGGPAIIRHF